MRWAMVQRPTPAACSIIPRSIVIVHSMQLHQLMEVIETTAAGRRRWRVNWRFWTPCTCRRKRGVGHGPLDIVLMNLEVRESGYSLVSFTKLARL